MRTYVYDDGRTESVLSYQEGGPKWDTMPRSALGHLYMLVDEFRRRGPPPSEPTPPSQKVHEAVFHEDYGLPRGQTLASGCPYQSVDAGQFVTLRKVFRKEEAALGIPALESKKEWAIYWEKWGTYYDKFVAWRDGPVNTSPFVKPIESEEQQDEKKRSWLWGLLSLASLVFAYLVMR